MITPSMDRYQSIIKVYEGIAGMLCGIFYGKEMLFDGLTCI